MTRRPSIKTLLITTLCMFILSPLCFADEIKIPFPLERQKFLKECKKRGVDLYDKKDSIGFAENRGGETTVYTYKNISYENMDKIKEAAFNSIRK